MKRLSNKVALITGASSGIGYASAQLFSYQGAKVILAARQQGKLNPLVDSINQQGGQALALAGDIQDEHYCRELVILAEKHFGGLDIAVNNAGVLGDMGPAIEMSLDQWNHVLDTNLTGAFLGAKYQLPAMQRRGSGSVIFTSSFVGHTAGMPGMAAYAASKAGLIGLTQGLAAEYGAQGIRVNALLPGGTNTPAAHEFAPTAEAIAMVEGLHALRRLAAPEEIAQSALYLASDMSSFTTGSALLADGGVSIYRS